MKLDYDERSIELGGADGARYFDRAAGLWREACIHFNLSVERTIFGITIPVMPLDQLVEYRQRLDREVDRQDVAALIAEYERDPADTISSEHDPLDHVARYTFPVRNEVTKGHGRIRLRRYAVRRKSVASVYRAEARRNSPLRVVPGATVLKTVPNLRTFV